MVTILSCDDSIKSEHVYHYINLCDALHSKVKTVNKVTCCINGSLFSYENIKPRLLISDDNGKLWAQGSNTFGQLGLGHNEDVNFPTQICDQRFLSAACGYFHTVAIDNDGKLWTCGNNIDDYAWTLEKMETKMSTRCVSVDCGRSHIIIIDENAELFGFGSNKYGQLGPQKPGYVNFPIYISKKKIVSVSCGGDHTMVIDENNDLWAYGSNKYGQ